MRKRNIWHHHHLILGIFSCLLLSRDCYGQCFGGVETYEKTSGTTVDCSGSDCESRGLLTQPDTSVTRDCFAICKQSSSCDSFTVDYMKSRCQSYSLISDSGQKLKPDTIVNYFEKICLRGVRQNQFDDLCNSERGWAFERVLDSSLNGFDDEIITDVASRNECARRCLFHEKFECRSAEYKSRTQACVLSREDRRTQPEAFEMKTTTGTDYIENQCSKPLPDCSYSKPVKDVTVVAMDDILFSRTVADCQRFCDDARAFHCRSFSQKNDRCYLSGDDSVTLPDVPLPQKIGTVYKEKTCARSTCDGGIFTYEKTTSHFLRTAQEEPLSLDTSSPGISGECSILCTNSGADCPAFSVDYGGQRCFKLDRNTQGRGDSLAPKDGMSYFEKICLRGLEVVSQCRDKVWSFERVPGKLLDVEPDQVFKNIPSRRDCEEICLRERAFICKSANYDSIGLTCALSRYDRRSRTLDFKDTSKNIDYVENGCTKPEEMTCPYQRIENAYPRYLDDIINGVKDEVGCEVQCSFYEKFLCRSFAFYSSANQCFISGDDTVSASDGALQTRPGTDYFERSCLEGRKTIDDQLGKPRISSEPRPTSPQEQRCTFGKLTYEKTTGYELIRGGPSRLYSDRDGGIIDKCTSRCEADMTCKGFNMDYNRNECQGLTSSSENNLFNLRPSSGVSYFEAVCLKGASCGVLWTFERFVDKELSLKSRKIHRDVSKTECEDFCLSENSFVCKSANYDHLRRDCYLLTENRFTSPSDFSSKQGIDYLENQCAFETKYQQITCEYSPQVHDQYLIYSDKVITAFSDSACKKACSTEQEFSCRSYSFLSQSRPGTPQCFLSGDTRSTAGASAFQIANGALYAEKDCAVSFVGKNDVFGSILPPGSRTNGRNTDYDDDNSNDNDDYDNDGVDLNCRDRSETTSFVKIIDFTYDRGRKREIEVSKDIGIIVECLQECSNRDCLAVSLQNERGGRQRCYEHSRSAGSDDRNPVAATGVTYFEKICVRRSCRKAWSFTLIPRYEFIGQSNEEIRNVKSVAECRNLCLETINYVCRSATYDANLKTCRLSEETRRSSPSDFRPASLGVDYLENECADIPSSCEYMDNPGMYLPFTDVYVSRVTDIEDCRFRCSSEINFNCRSFNFNSYRKECFLSSDDSISLPSGLHQDRDFTFSERGRCNDGISQKDVRVECTPGDMLVTLAFGEEFTGRIYATGNPQTCFELGTGQTEMTLKIPIGSQCGTVQQNRGRYVNHVVIQKNPVIMQDTDKTVRVECAFTAEDQTVSFRPTGGGGLIDGRRESGGGISVTVPFQPTGTNIVTNTAPTPGVRMRVIRRNGETASIVGLGENLQLRIEIDQDSAFGLFARKLEARTDNGELMNLIDDTGCPINELIFPALLLEQPTRALYADFKAFRFPSTPIVNFIATVQFCQDLCDPMQCAGGLESYGKRRKRSSSNNTSFFPIRDEKPNLLPERVDLGLRLTVGENVLQKPFLPSRQGNGGAFPEVPVASSRASEAYYPSMTKSDFDTSSSTYLCSSQSSIIAAAFIVLVIHVLMIAGFVLFYHKKKKEWSKNQESSSGPALPPRSSTTPGVTFKSSPYGNLRQQRINTSMTTLPRS